MDKKEQKDIDEIMDKTNIQKEHSLTTEMRPTSSLVGHVPGIAIEGLEDVPMNMVALPYLRLVQPTSKKVQMESGKDAPTGSFLFNDTQESFEELDFILLRAKKEDRRVDEKGMWVNDDYEGKTFLKPRLVILGITLNQDKLFILGLSSTSFSSFGRLLAKLKGLEVRRSWQFAIKMTSEMQENDKGKYAIANFQLQKELTENQLEFYTKTALEYGVILDRSDIVYEE